MIRTENFKKVEITSAKELRKWLMENCSSHESFWLITYKKGEGMKYVSREEVLDELISFGWIDGIRRKLDEERTMQLISQRKTQHWAKTYKERAQRLIKEERMHERGFQSIKEGKESGLWNFMDDVDNLVVPKDLFTALSQKAEALVFFNAINNSSKRFVLRWLKLAKTDKTRQKRIQQLVELSAKGEKLKGS